MRFGIRLAFLLAAVLTVAPVSAQYAEVPRPMPVPSAGVFRVSSWLVRPPPRRSIAGSSSLALSPGCRRRPAARWSSILVGHYIPGAFPYFAGTVTGIVADSAGGWLVVGDFVSVNGRPIARFARVAPDRTVDERYRVVADGAIAKVALAHGRIYLAGDFTAAQRRRAPRTGRARRRQWEPSRGGARASTHAVACGSCRSRRSASTSPAAPNPGICGGSTRPPVACSSIARVSCRRWRHRPVSSTSAAPGIQRPVWAVNPFTGADTDWAPGLTFAVHTRHLRLGRDAGWRSAAGQRPAVHRRPIPHRRWPRLAHRG